MCSVSKDAMMVEMGFGTGKSIRIGFIAIEDVQLAMEWLDLDWGVLE